MRPPKPREAAVTGRLKAATGILLCIPFAALVLLLNPLADAAEPAEALKPYTHQVDTAMTLSEGVSIDDPDRVVHWMGEKPEVIERAKDSVRWAGDPKYWAEGEFVENPMPVEYPAGTPGVNVRCSKHVRIVYGNHPTMTEEYVHGNLRLFEECLKLYYLKIGFPVPFEDRDPAKRDGKKHKVTVIVGGSNLPPHQGKAMFTADGCWGCYDGHFGYLMCGPGSMRHTPPSGATPHEMAHACQMHANVHSPGSGFWWEAHANWMMLQYINCYPLITMINQHAAFYWGHGRHYYDCWQIFEHLKDEPGFGYDFITRLWAGGNDMEYIWNKAEKLAAPRSMADEWGKMARRNITWDYGRHAVFIKEDTDPTKLRLGRVLLEPMPFDPGWFRVPWAMAPQQFGYNICPLKATARQVTADFQGYADPERGSDWRVCFVAVGPGAQTGPPLDAEGHPVPGKAHSNGGGFVADTAKVDATAYVGPNATVLDTAQVSGSARVEDRAVVRGHAAVRERAVVSGYGMVQDNAQISGLAHVAGYSVAGAESMMTARARLIDYSATMEHCRVDGHATMKGRSVSWGAAHVGATAILDGDYANGISVDKNVWFLWFVNDQKKADAAEDLNGIYAQYRFEKKHPYLAWDTNGATHGLLIGNPEIRTSSKPEGAAIAVETPAHFLVLDGSSQFVELRSDVAFQCDLSAQLMVRREALATDQTVFEFASPDSSNRIGLILAAPDGRPKLAVRRQGVDAVLAAPYQIPKGTWTKIGVGVGEAGAVMMLNDRIACEAPRLTVEPWDLGLRAGALGRGIGGNWFKGALANVTFSSLPLVDRRPPEPDPAQWLQRPVEIEVTEPGVHLVQVWMDRDGAVMDELGVAVEKEALKKLQ